MYEYDDVGRLAAKTQTIKNQTFVVNNHYDEFSRLNKITYPTGFELKRHYNINGYLEKLTNIDEATTFWKATQLNARGQLEDGVNTPLLTQAQRRELSRI